MKKVTFTEEKTGLQIIERKYTQATGYHDLSGEWVTTGRERVHLFEVLTKSGEVLKIIRNHRFPNVDNRTSFTQAKNFLYAYARFAYEKEYHPRCNQMRSKTDFPKLPCPMISIHQDKVLCQIRPFTGGYMGSSDGARPLPDEMKCDLKYSSVPMVDVYAGLTLQDLLDCASGEARRKIERQPVEFDDVISLGWEGVK